MPIAGPSNLRPIDQAAFAELDYHVMRRAFESQNRLGRLCEEEIYQNDLNMRLEADGLAVSKEVPIEVTYNGFKKTYLLDLLIANTSIYELKAASALTGAHETQLLNYVLLGEARHGKLINFRPAQVESRFINATLTLHERRQFSTDMERWRETNPIDKLFLETVLGLLSDWGCRLDLALYIEAITWLLGGEDQVVKRVLLSNESGRLGTQSFHLINAETAFRLTALTEGFSNYEHHLRAMLELSPLRTLQWVNMDRQKIRFITLTR